jgi:hypothetical protein
VLSQQVKNDDAESPTEQARQTAEIIPFLPREVREESDDLGTVDDALAWTPEVLAEGVTLQTPLDTSDPALSLPMVIMRGPHAEAKRWKRQETVVGAVMTRFLGHAEGKKDGEAWVLADIADGCRSASGVQAIYAVGLDMDGGHRTGAEIDADVAAMGCMAVRYTTHSHLSRQTRLKRDRVTEWARKQGFAVTPDHADPALLSAYLRQVKGYADQIAATAELTETAHTAAGIELVVSHAAIEKHRLVFPLSRPFRIAEQGATQREAHAKWRRICDALARKLKVVIDSTGGDVNRMFYLPRHPPGGVHNTSLFGGRLLDWERDLELAAEPPAATGKKTQSEAGQALAGRLHKIADGLQIGDVIRDHAPERIRHDGGSKLTVECPFDHLHGNAGDPSDAACFACNAQDGPSPIFTVSCRHDGCQGLTAYDMTAQMIADGWFSEEELFDPAYDAVDRSAEAAPTQAEPADPTEIRARIANIDPEVEGADEAAEAVLDMLVPIKSSLKVEGLLKALDKQLGKGRITGLRAGLKERRRVADETAKEEARANGKKVERVRIGDDGHMTMAIAGEPDQQAIKDFARRAIDAQNAEEPTYTTVAGEIMRLRVRNGMIKFEPLTERRMWGEITDLTSLVRMTDTGLSDARQLIDKDIFAAVFQTLEPRLPMTPEIIHRPTHLRSGVLVSEPGWYRGENGELGVYLAHGAPSVEVKLDANQQDAADAADYLAEEVLIDFPFRDVGADGTTSEHASRANALAMLLTPMARYLYDGPAPLFLVQKPQSGAGGTLLAQLPALISDGRPVRPMPFLRDGEEVQKQLVSALLAGINQFLFDNVRRLDSPDLLIALTTELLGGRILGRSVDVERPNKFLWTATGINPVISEEMIRRIAFINIDPQVADVRGRNFHHADLTSWVLDNRGVILSKLLTMVQAWLNAGRPAYTGPTLPSFGRWAEVLGGVLQHAGVTGFLDTPAVESSDFQAEATSAFLADWSAKFGEEPQSPAALFGYALGIEAGFLRGRDEVQQRQNFLADLATLKNRTVLIRDVEWVVTQTLDKAKAKVWAMVKKERVA